MLQQNAALNLCHVVILNTKTRQQVWRLTRGFLLQTRAIIPQARTIALQQRKENRGNSLKRQAPRTGAR
ncbi:hypothetical protein AK51_00940 [Serratia nematodiphila DZ0503SBS1]|nr:hypothetical protein AK51_00940 [Serratia nematodiphila DZ0503SBS1]